jgi:nicotinamide riboside kinase
MELEPGAHLSEVARQVMRETGFNRDTVSKLEMQEAILKAHLDREVDFRKKKKPILSDRSAVDPIVYALMTSQDGAERNARRTKLISLPGFAEALEDYRDQSRSIFILLSPVPEWLVDDGVRSMEKGDECVQEFRALLKTLKIPFLEMGPEIKDLGARTRLVLDTIGGSNTARLKRERCCCIIS